jgi:hypothetical protein
MRNDVQDRGRRRRTAPAAAAIGLIAGLVGGCAGAPARPAAAPPPPSPAALAAEAESQQRRHAAEALCQQLFADPALAPLRGRLMPADPREPWTRAMMVDTAFADARDRALLRVMDERRAHCRQAMLAASPGQAVPFYDYWARQDAALVRLYDRQIQIGAYNRAMADAQAQLAIDLNTQRSENAARANQPGLAPAPEALPRAGAPQVSLDSLRALAGR